MMDISVVILAGGKSARMGADKKFLKLKEKKFIHMVVKAAEKISDDILISLGTRDQMHELKKAVKYPICLDEEKEKGPLFGLISAIPHLGYRNFAIMPIDCPMVNPSVYKKMADYIDQFNGVVPIGRKGMEPLQGIYNKHEFMDAARKNIANDKTSVTDTVVKIPNVKYMDKEEFRPLDPNLLTFKNINRPQDYQEMLGLLGDN